MNTGRWVVVVYLLAVFAFLVALAAEIGDTSPAYVVDWKTWFTGLVFLITPFLFGFIAGKTIDD